MLLNLQLVASGVPLHAMTAVRAGIMGKVAVGSLVASPLVMFLGMGMGYWLHKESQALRDQPPPPPALAPPPPPERPRTVPTPRASCVAQPFGCSCGPLGTLAMASAELSALEHASIGAGVGSIEMAIMRPAAPCIVDPVRS